MRFAIGCAVACLSSCAGPLEEQGALRAGAPAAEESRSVHSEAERIGLDFVADMDESGDSTIPEDAVVSTILDDAVVARQARILQELKTLDPSSIWGTYAEEPVFDGAVLSVAPESGATYTWRGCLGVYDANHGDVVEVDGRTIRLDLEVDPKLNRPWYPSGRGSRYMSNEWFVFDWGNRRYMIPSSQMIPFCNDVNSGSSVDYPSRLLGNGEGPSGSRLIMGAERPDEPPQVPDRYRPFLLSEPVHAEIIRTEEPTLVGEYALGEPKYRVMGQIDRGRSAGLLPGMTLEAKYRLWIQQVEVVSVQDLTARVRMHTSRVGDVPMPGSIYSTGPHR